MPTSGKKFLIQNGGYICAPIAIFNSLREIDVPVKCPRDLTLIKRMTGFQPGSGTSIHWLRWCYKYWNIKTKSVARVTLREIDKALVKGPVVLVYWYRYEKTCDCHACLIIGGDKESYQIVNWHLDPEHKVQSIARYVISARLAYSRRYNNTSFSPEFNTPYAICVRRKKKTCRHQSK